MTLFITVRNIAKLPMGCNARPLRVVGLRYVGVPTLWFFCRKPFVLGVR